MSVDELEVKTRHKRKLAIIREKEDVSYNGKHDNGDEHDRRYPEIAIGSVQTNSGENGEIVGTLGPGAQGMENGARDSRGYDQRIRSTDAAPLAPDSGIDRSGYAPRKFEIALSPEEKLERERELARQRKQRQREREKETAAFLDEDISSSTRDRDRAPQEEQQSRFTLKNPLKYPKLEKVKLFTSKEIDLEKEHLSFVYFKGSGLLDEILTIIVKGHEEVQIWQLDAGEADMLAEMHLERAKTNMEAARSARILLALYDRIFTLELIVPRLFATGRYVKQQGGLSFR